MYALQGCHKTHLKQYFKQIITVLLIMTNYWCYLASCKWSRPQISVKLPFKEWKWKPETNYSRAESLTKWFFIYLFFSETCPQLTYILHLLILMLGWHNIWSKLHELIIVDIALCYDTFRGDIRTSWQLTLYSWLC